MTLRNTAQFDIGGRTYTVTLSIDDEEVVRVLKMLAPEDDIDNTRAAVIRAVTKVDIDLLATRERIVRVNWTDPLTVPCNGYTASVVKLADFERRAECTCDWKAPHTWFYAELADYDARNHRATHTVMKP